MLWKIIQKDISRSRLISLTLCAFICASAALVASAAMLIVKLSGSTDALMSAAIAPDYMQMHAGSIDEARLIRFSESQPYIRAQQTVAFLNLDGSDIVWADGSDLSSSVQDNGLCVQSEGFDYLIGEDRSVLRPNAGEVYVPICYAENACAEEHITICGRPFSIAGILRDSQMEPSFASSKRFLVNEADYAALRDFGSEEFLIEFLLTDRSYTGALQTAYADTGLECAGPSVSYVLFRLLNALSGGILAGVLILVSVLIVGIAFLCIRFTLLTKLSDDAREIGVMRALGLSQGDITRVYLGKYLAVSALGCAAGYALSFPLRAFLLTQLKTMPWQEGETLAAVLGVAGVLLLFAGICLYVCKLLKRTLGGSAAQALRSGAGTDGKKARALHFNAALGANTALALSDLLSRRRLYATFFTVLTLACFIVIVPQNMYATIISPSFIGYMGTGGCDMRIDLQHVENVKAQAEAIEEALLNDPHVEKYAVFAACDYTMLLSDGGKERLLIDKGDHASFPALYNEGGTPQLDEDIALSSLLAGELGKRVGDTLTLTLDGAQKTLRVCGVYADFTNGGKTAKAVFNDPSEQPSRYMFNVDFVPGTAEAAAIEAYQDRFENAKASNVEKYVAQTLGGSIRSLRTASRVSLVCALLVCALITALFMKMLVSRDAADIALLRALGFSQRDIQKQYLMRALAVTLLAFMLGDILANTAGEWAAAQLIATLGASGMHFVSDPLRSYLLNPALLALSVLLAAALSLASAGKIKISDHIRE